MIKRLYADNYRCLVNFEMQPDAETLLLGANGSGKSSAIDALRLLQRWICGWGRADVVVDADDLTAWYTGFTMAFELGIETDGLSLEPHNPDPPLTRLGPHRSPLTLPQQDR